LRREIWESRDDGHEGDGDLQDVSRQKERTVALCRNAQSGRLFLSPNWSEQQSARGRKRRSGTYRMLSMTR
jgi:hypothetical protein